MSSDLRIRPASVADAEAAALLLRRSITELCVPDHGNDPERLAGWLENKTSQHFRQWLADPLNTIVVAMRGGLIASVGGIREGEGISLNYIHPDMRFLGISRQMMAHLEAVLVERGYQTANLTATITAQPFYETLGYQVCEFYAGQRPLYGVAMEKRL